MDTTSKIHEALATLGIGTHSSQIEELVAGALNELAALQQDRAVGAQLRVLLGANEGESTIDALHRYTAAVQLVCALKLEQRAKEVAAQPAIVPVPKVREVTVAALIGGATLLRQGVTAAGNSPGFPDGSVRAHPFRSPPNGDDVCQEPGDFAHSICGSPRIAHADRTGEPEENAPGDHRDKPSAYLASWPHDFMPDAQGVDACQRRDTQGTVCSYPKRSHRYPCSPTCTHDDAATPGHAERVKERSEAVEEIGRHPENDSDTFRTIENGVEGAVFTRTQTERYAEKKAEAMRAACWGAVQAELQKMGVFDAGIRGCLKAAIEGAAP